jgi:hypothetical protein
MASPSQDVETTLTFSGTAEQHVTTSERYSTVIIQNDTTVPVYVAVDGGTAIAPGNDESEVPAGQTMEFDNELGLPNSNLNAGQTATNWQSGPSGGGAWGGGSNPNSNVADTVHDQSMSWAWTSQSGFAETGSTYASVIPSATTTGSVTVTFQ